MFFRRILRPGIPPSPSPIPFDMAEDTDTLARTIWGEARGESLAGKEAVANVVMNRVEQAQKRGEMWWGNSITEVCLKKYQFSCWLENDPNYFKLRAVGSDDPNFATCLRIARRAVQGTLNDNTNGADHYHASYVAPKWADRCTPVAEIGNHLFYKLEK
jgi:N-acetylmuramoyl-L-alanine amidase